MSDVKTKFADVVRDFEKDPAKERNGAWMRFKNFEYLVARAHRENVEYKKLIEVEMRPFQWAIDRNDLTSVDEATREALQRVYSKTILKAIRRANSTIELDYTPEDGASLFKALPDFWDKLFAFAHKEQNYEPDYTEPQITSDSGN